MKNKILNIIYSNCYTEENKPEDSVIMGDDFFKLAEELEALFALCEVSKSLPTMVSVLSAAHKEADKDYEDNEPANHILRCGFIKGVNWYKKEIEVKR